MIVSLGILAHNEEATIGAMLRSLFAQSVFSDESMSWITSLQVIVVANGCSDSTPEIADAASRQLGQSHRVVVEKLERADKSSAWNFFVHDAARDDADIMVLLDADIELGNRDTLINCLTELRDSPQVDVVVDLPIKDLAKKPKLTIAEKISLRQSAIGLADVGISGQFYCARAATLRNIWIPPGLPVEDGYVYGMVVTDSFRGPVDKSRVARAPRSHHYYAAETNLRALVRHETRLVIGTTLNSYLMWQFLDFAMTSDGPGAGAFVRQKLEANPHWYREMMQKNVEARGAWVLPSGIAFRKFRRLRGSGPLAALRRCPLALIGFFFDIPVMLGANHRLRQGRGPGYW